jgi:c-di-GMP-related signal transduction protein
MAVFVARQPILDRSRRTCAYELLYRRATTSTFDGAEGDQATLSVLDASFFVVGIESLTGGRQAFVNFTRETLIKGYAASVPRERLVVEVLEDILPDAEVVAACRGLKASGYLIALDDVVTVDVPAALLDLADIVKVDFQQTDGATRRAIARAFRRRQLRLLAEKVETGQDVEQALADGYELFQGYFFARPSIVSGREVPAVKQNLLGLLRETYQADPDHRRIEEIIRHDVALAFKLLARMRGVTWGWQRVESVRHALLLLGDRGLRRWASIVAVGALGHDQPPELVVTSLVRAAFCEGLMGDLGRDDLTEEGFLVGLFSAIDAFLGCPLAEALERLAVPDVVRAALLGEDHPLRSALDLNLAYERGDWEEVSRLAAVLAVADDVVTTRYREAVEYGNALGVEPSTPGRPARRPSP